MKDLLAPDDTRDALRKYGGLLLGLGVLLLLIRKGDDMSDFVLFLILAATAAYLYGSVFTTQYTDGPRPWQAVHSVFGLLFVPLALIQFIELVDGSMNELNTFWIFGVTAALGFYAGAVKGIRFHLLAGSIAAIVAWTALWDKLLGDEGIAEHFGTYRGLLGILAILLLAGALYLWRERPEAHVVGTATESGGDAGAWKASELLTGAGIAAVIACGLTGITQPGVAILSGATGGLLDGGVLVATNTFWDILLLVVSLGLVGLAAVIGTRGPAYVGAIGLVLFLYIVGGDLNEGGEADPTNLGLWPIILLVLGALMVALSAVKEASQGDKPRTLISKLRGR
jgi:hypothetical protein